VDVVQSTLLTLNRRSCRLARAVCGAQHHRAARYAPTHFTLEHKGNNSFMFGL
jgi:hypothetical protein